MIYFVDPELRRRTADTRQITEITLSYTFFPAEPAKRPTKTRGRRSAAALGGAAEAGL